MIHAAIVHGNAGLPGVIALYVQRNPARVLLQVILALALAGLALLPPVLIGSLIDRVIAGTVDMRLAWLATVAVFALAALDGAMTWVRKRKAVTNEISLRAAVADAHFRSCMRLPSSEFQQGNHLFLIGRSTISTMSSRSSPGHRPKSLPTRRCLLPMPC